MIHGHTNIKYLSKFAHVCVSDSAYVQSIFHLSAVRTAAYLLTSAQMQLGFFISYGPDFEYFFTMWTY